MKHFLHLFLIIYLVFQLVNCAASKSDINGLDDTTFQRKDRIPADILFEFSHMKMTKGFDVIPKSMYRPGIDDFNDILIESMKEISNIHSYRLYTNNSNNIKDPQERDELIALKNSADFTIKIDITRNKSFVKHFLGTIGSIISLTILPIGYSWEYEFKTEVYNKSQKIFETHRSASVTNWIEALLIFAYPFHPEERKNEEIYLGMLKNIFQEIENKGILSQQNLSQPPKIHSTTIDSASQSIAPEIISDN